MARLFESVLQHWPIFSEMAPPVKAAAQTLPEGYLRRLKEAIADALGPFVEGGRVFLTATPIVRRGDVIEVLCPRQLGS